MKQRFAIINALWAIASIVVSCAESDAPFYFINLTVTVVLMRLIDKEKRYKRYLSICLIFIQISFFSISILYARAFADITNLIKTLSIIFVAIAYFLLFPINEKGESAN